MIKDITSSPFNNTVAEFLITRTWISIGLNHSPTKCEENLLPITNVKNPPST